MKCPGAGGSVRSEQLSASKRCASTCRQPSPALVAAGRRGSRSTHEAGDGDDSIMGDPGLMA